MAADQSREAKYKAKQAVDSFFVRAGDVLQAGARLHRRAGRAGRARRSRPSIIVLTGGWLAVVVGLNRRTARRRRTAQVGATASP